MKATRRVLAPALLCAMVLGVAGAAGWAAGCGGETGKDATITTVGVTSTIAPTTTTTQGSPAWTQLEPGGDVPTARTRHAMVYDPVARRMILFGGFSGSTFLVDTWAYDPFASTWTELHPSGDVPSGPLFSVAYDSHAARVIACSSSVLMWAYDPAANTWAALHPVGDGPAGTSVSLAYQPASGRLIAFGGLGGGGRGGTELCFNETWAYDLAANTWTNLKPVGSLPPARWNAPLVYDAQSDRMILFGGQDAAYGSLADAWAYDPVANTWTALQPSGDAPRLAVMPFTAYDSDNGRVIVFGQEYDVAWLYDLATNAWTAFYPAGPRPASRLWCQLVYDPSRHKVLLFGGSQEERDSTGEYTETYYDDTWACGINP